jgi:hypothetical protein
MSWLPNLLHPSLFVWFLPLVLVPILLHLLTLHRLKTVELPTFRFLFDSYVQQRRRTQFLEALLAMLRTAFMLFLLLIISRPVVKHWSALFQGGSGREVVLVVDCSASMNAVTGGVSAFERAKLAASTIIERLNPDDKVTLLRVTAKPEELFSQYSADSAAVKDRIEGLSTSPTRANMFAAFRQLFGPESPRRKDPLVYLFTDCQLSGWKEAKQQNLERLIPTEAQFIVVNVASRDDLPNLAVIGDAPQRRTIVGLPVELNARVVNHSKARVENASLSVMMNDKEVHRFKLDRLEPGETVKKSFYYEPPEPGIVRGRFELVGKSIDRFPDDDTFLFTLTVAPRLKVVIINGSPSPDPFESESLYLRTALTVTEENGKQKEAIEKKSGRDFLRSLDVQDVPEVGLTMQAIQDASVVIVANCGNLTPPQFGYLRDFVEQGGGLVVLPGDRVNPDVYNSTFFPEPPPQRRTLTPVRLGKPEGDPEKTATFDRLTSLDFSHPVLSVFDDPKARYFNTVYFKRRFPLQLPEKREGVRVLADFSTGAPALVESRFGDGRVILAAFPANAKWTNLPTRYGEFVPLVLRLVDYVQHAPELQGPSVVPDGAVAEIVVANSWAPVTAVVRDPKNHATDLAFERDGRWLKSAYTPGVERGYYTIEIKGGKGDAPKSGSLAFAVNLPPAESDFKFIKDQVELHEVLPSEKLTLVDASAEQQQEYGSVGREREIWRYLIYILFVVIGVEFMLATAGGAKRSLDETTTVAERIANINPGNWIGRMTGGAARKPSAE